MTCVVTTALVHIVTLSGDEYDEVERHLEAAGSRTHALAAYLSQWDYGQETDDAALLWPDDLPTVRDLERQVHPLHRATVGGQIYLVQIDPSLHHCALYRPALPDLGGEVA